MNKGALALLVRGGTENWSPERWNKRFDEVCARQFINHYGLMLFRRPLTLEESARYVRIVQTGTAPQWWSVADLRLYE